MYLRAGIPLAADVEAMKRNEAFGRHVEFNRNFIAAHSEALKGYGFHWGDDPLRLWSRRWEYPFSAQKILDFAATAGDRPLRILDAGSGVTYFPYFLCSHLPNASVTCCDSNLAYERMFAAINERTPASRVTFKTAFLQSLPLEDASQDAICCISVLEHTDNYRAVLGEFRRVLRPGGLLVMTFDLSLDGRFKLSRAQAAELLGAIGEMYTIPGVDVNKELARLDQRDEILSTDLVRRTEPALLPWKYPLLLAIKDLLSGKGWTGGFRSKSVFCLEARKLG
jgi:ubiquinone/menaquinone biosynthesis C-methylase UbiE